MIKVTSSSVRSVPNVDNILKELLCLVVPCQFKKNVSSKCNLFFATQHKYITMSLICNVKCNAGFSPACNYAQNHWQFILSENNFYEISRYPKLKRLPQKNASCVLYVYTESYSARSSCGEGADVIWSMCLY